MYFCGSCYNLTLVTSSQEADGPADPALPLPPPEAPAVGGGGAVLLSEDRCEAIPDRRQEEIRR